MVGVAPRVSLDNGRQALSTRQRNLLILAGQIDGRAGSHVYHRELARRFSARGHRVTVVGFGHDGSLGTIPVHVIPRTAAPQIPGLWRFASLLDYRNIRRQFPKLSLDTPDVAICGEHLLLKPFRRRFPGVPLIYFPCAPFVRHEICGYGLSGVQLLATLRLYQHLQRWALTHADATVRFTKASWRLLEREYHLPSEHAARIVNPIGVDLPDVPRRNPPGNRPVRLLMTGRLVSWKGHALALRALATMRDRSWTLDVVGDGEMRQELETLSRTLGLADRVRFHGYENDLTAWYRSADLFLFPSSCESLGLVLIDAMAHGVPALGIRPDGNRYVNVNDELIDDGRTGLLANSEHDFERRLRAALMQPETLAVMGALARADVARRFSWSAHLDTYERVFDAVLKQRVARSGGTGYVLSGRCHAAMCNTDA